MRLVEEEAAIVKSDRELAIERDFEAHRMIYTLRYYSPETRGIEFKILT